MITGRPKKPITLSDEEREQLSAIVSSRSLPHGLVRRARIILMAADGYGKGKVIGFHQGSEIVIRTSDTQKSFLLRKEPSPEELAKIAHDHFKKISDERKMEHS